MAYSQHTAGARFHRTLVSLLQYQQMWLLSRVCWDFCLWGGCMASTKYPPSRGATFPRVARGPIRPLCLLMDVLTRALPGTFSPEHCQVLSFKPHTLSSTLRNPVVLKPSHFSPSVVLGNRIFVRSSLSCFTLFFFFFLFSYFWAGGGLVFLHDPDMLHCPLFSFLPSLHIGDSVASLRWLTSPYSVPAKFSDSNYADYCINPQINFLGVQNGLMLIFDVHLAAFHG